MASHFEDEDPTIKECANCGSTENLGKCSRCHSAWFCGVKCQKAYWPFHREWCKKNDFADAIEKTEPKFAKWMRKHGKQAVVKDDEVDRLERKTATMEDMYGKSNPKPLPPAYTSEDRRKMRSAEEKHLLEQMYSSNKELLWKDVVIPEQLGLECSDYKWRQNQSNVEIYIMLPDGLEARFVHVSLATSSIQVSINGEPLLTGELFAPIKAEESTWLIHDGILEILLLKRYRRGHYEDGKTNADTFWYSVLKKCPNKDEVLALEHPPSEYYSTEYEKETSNVSKAMARLPKYDRPMIDRSREN